LRENDEVAKVAGVETGLERHVRKVREDKKKSREAANAKEKGPAAAKVLPAPTKGPPLRDDFGDFFFAALVVARKAVKVM
jgi:hypothetical protein